MGMAMLPFYVPAEINMQCVKNCKVMAITRLLYQVAIFLAVGAILLEF
jgi:hypothetical protein